jgi:type III secretion protein T
LTSSIPAFYQGMVAFAIAFARIAPVFYLMPFLNDRAIVGATVRNTVIFAVIVGLRPELPDVPMGASLAFWLLLVLKEAAVGIVLGVSLALPFWVGSTVGELVDNARGATMADSIDPATGVEASVLGPFMTLFYAAAFLQEGGMHTVMHALAESYRYVEVGGKMAGDVMQIGALLTDVVGKGIELAAPVLIVMFLSDVLLGVFSRFCPQLNALSVSMSVKSILAFTVFYLYFEHALPSSLLDLLAAHPFASLLR